MPGVSSCISRSVEELHEELLAIVQGREGHQGQLAIRRDEEATRLPQQWKEGLERTLIERLCQGLEGGVAAHHLLKPRMW